MQNIFLYCDTGVNKYLLQKLVRQLNKKANCIPIKAQEVINSDWAQKAHLFIIPGGRDLPYVSKLKNAGTEAIRNYVLRGGNFLGICAGAYFASSYVEFDKGGPLHVEGARDLRFFSGRAIGPIFGTFSYKNRCGAEIIPISYHDERTKISAMCYYHGGCYFEELKSPSHSVLATYKNGLAAIVRRPVGKGQAVLSGVHFEVSLKNKEHEEKRQQLMQAIMLHFEKMT